MVLSPPLAANSELTSEQVAAYLNSNPDFFEQYPHLLTVLQPPEAGHKGNVADFQKYMIGRLQEEVHDLSNLQHSLLVTARDNLDTLDDLLQACAMILQAEHVDEVLRIITEAWPALLGIDVCAVAVESSHSRHWLEAYEYVAVLPTGDVRLLLRGQSQTVFRPHVRGDARLYGKQAFSVASDALVPLPLAGAVAPPALLAFAANQAGAFSPGLGDDLIAFVATVVAQVLRLLQPTA